MKTWLAVIAMLLCACGSVNSGGETGGEGGSGGEAVEVTPRVPAPVAPEVGPCGVVPNADCCACALECPTVDLVGNRAGGSPECWARSCSQGVCGVALLPAGQPCSAGACDASGLCVDKL